jgi:hypothetical protein
LRPWRFRGITCRGAVVTVQCGVIFRAKRPDVTGGLGRGLPPPPARPSWSCGTSQVRPGRRSTWRPKYTTTGYSSGFPFVQRAVRLQALVAQPDQDDAEVTRRPCAPHLRLRLLIAQRGAQRPLCGTWRWARGPGPIYRAGCICNRPLAHIVPTICPQSHISPLI